MKRLSQFMDLAESLTEATNKGTFSRNIKFLATPDRPKSMISKDFWDAYSYMVIDDAKSAVVKKTIKMAKELFSSTLHNTSKKHVLTVLVIRSNRVHERIKEKYTYFYLIDGYPWSVVASDTMMKKKETLYLGEWLEWTFFYSNNKGFGEGDLATGEDHLTANGESNVKEGWVSEPPVIKDPKLKNLVLNIDYDVDNAREVLDGEIEEAYLTFKNLQDAYDNATQWVDHRFIYADEIMQKDVRDYFKHSGKDPDEIDEADIDDLMRDADWNWIDEHGDGDYHYEFESAARQALFKHAIEEDFLQTVDKRYHFEHSEMDYEIRFRCFEGEGAEVLYITVGDDEDDYGYVHVKNPDKQPTKRIGQVIERALYEDKLAWWPR